MKKHFLLILMIFLMLFFTPVVSTQAATGYLLKIDSSIGPVTYQRVKNTIALAGEKNAEFILLEIDTPGGLLQSTRKIVQELLKSDIPVIGFVSPGGAQCASAGTFIALSCHILAMAPATNIGAAHPVTLSGQPGEKMEEKLVNDTVSFIKSIARHRNRNEKWAEKAVRESSSLTEQEAFAENVIDLVAKNSTELLEKIDGKIISLPDGEKKLITKNIQIFEPERNFKDRILQVITDPNIAYILLIIGIWGIMLEFSHPGMGIPGVVGTISLILAFFALHALPISTAGLILIIVSFIFFVIEALTPSFGIFIISGMITLILGSFMLFKPIPQMEIAYSLIVSAALTTGILLWFVIWFAYRTRKRPVMTGMDGLVGEKGKVSETLKPEGTVYLHGEYWKAVSKSGEIKQGEKIKVAAYENFTLIVEPVKENQEIL
jgi:membrane-bound serine protease (ClpP class)